MRADDIKPWMRVRLVNAVYYDLTDHITLKAVDAGATGRVMEVRWGAKANEPYAMVLFDRRIAALDAWGNLLYVYREDGDVLPQDFEAI